MKLDFIEIKEIKHRPLMNGIELSFPANDNDYINTNCLIGINGSGKSQLLETIAEIFLYVDRIYRPTNRIRINHAPVLFCLRYSLIIKDRKFKVEISQKISKGKDPLVKVWNNRGEVVELKFDQINDYLPVKIVGYTSGENETLSSPFLSYYDKYADYTAKRALGNQDNHDYNPRFYFMDYNTNLGIAISNLVYDTDLENKNDSIGLTQIKKELNIQKLHSFQIVIQTKQTAAPGRDGIILTTELKGWLEKLKRAATNYDYSEKENKYTLDYLLSSASKEALSNLFGSPYDLYTALYKFELLNNIIVPKQTRENIEKLRAQRKLTTKMPEVPDKDKVMRYSEIKLELSNGQLVDYLSLSDGEHQYFNVFGTVQMTDDENSLFLFDEPETHFNPKWRRLFISKLNGITKGRSQDMFLTSHSPFIVSDTPKEFVYIFKRISKDKIEVEYPKLETFGGSFNHILKMAFDLDDSMSAESALFIQGLLKSDNPKEIEEGISKLGDSPRVMSLYRRLDMLENKK